MNKTLYIIGNGFDLYHGLDTRYDTFGKFLKKNYWEIYNNLIDYISLPPISENSKGFHKESLWADFESALANIDIEYTLNEHTDYLPNLSSDDYRDSDLHAMQQVMERFVQTLTNNLKDAFREFILQVKIHKSIEHKLINIEDGSLFLNFNYTDTLEKLYKIDPKNIVYIHNKAKDNDKGIILGHGLDPEEISRKYKIIPPEGLNEEELDLWRQEQSDNYDYSYDSAKEELIYYFGKSFKNTKEIINQHYSFFERISNVEKVFILGHSLSDIDKPYFLKIIKSIWNKNIEWNVSYNYEDDIESHKKKLKDFGLKEEQIKMITIEDLRHNETQ